MENRLGVQNVAGVVMIERCAMNLSEEDAIHLAVHLVAATADGLTRFEDEIERLGLVDVLERVVDSAAATGGAASEGAGGGQAGT